MLSIRLQISSSYILSTHFSLDIRKSFMSPWGATAPTLVNFAKSTELLGLFSTLSIVLYVEDKRPQCFGDWICLRPQVDGAG
jgi:hypothetical protein